MCINDAHRCRRRFSKQTMSSHSQDIYTFQWKLSLYFFKKRFKCSGFLVAHWRYAMQLLNPKYPFFSYAFHDSRTNILKIELNGRFWFFFFCFFLFFLTWIVQSHTNTNAISCVIFLQKLSWRIHIYIHKRNGTTTENAVVKIWSGRRDVCKSFDDWLMASVVQFI